MPMVIDDPNEVRALHRMLFARKFEGPEDEFFGSPYIASVQRRLLDELRAIDLHPWEEWVDARGHEREVEKVRSYLRGLGPRWMEMTPDERSAYVRDLLSPLVVSQDLLTDLTTL